MCCAGAERGITTSPSKIPYSLPTCIKTQTPEQSLPLSKQCFLFLHSTLMERLTKLDFLSQATVATTGTWDLSDPFVLLISRVPRRSRWLKSRCHAETIAMRYAPGAVQRCLEHVLHQQQQCLSKLGTVQTGSGFPVRGIAICGSTPCSLCQRIILIKQHRYSM